MRRATDKMRVAEEKVALNFQNVFFCMQRLFKTSNWMEETKASASSGASFPSLKLSTISMWLRWQPLENAWKKKKSVLLRELASSGGFYFFFITKILHSNSSEKARVCSNLWQTTGRWLPRLRMPGRCHKSLEMKHTIIQYFNILNIFQIRFL